MKISELLRMNFGIEDNAQVEVNFNIDTDSNGAVEANDIDELEAKTDVNEAVADSIEAQAETARSADEVEELEEAQDALESLGHVLFKAHSEGELSRMALSTYRASLESILGKHNVDQLQVPSMESFQRTSLGTSVEIALESHKQTVRAIQRISNESKMNLVQRIFSFLKSLINSKKEFDRLLNKMHSKVAAHNFDVFSKLSVSIGRSRVLVPEDIDKIEQIIQDHIELFRSARIVSENEFSIPVLIDNIFPNKNRWPKVNGVKMLKIGRVTIEDSDGTIKISGTKAKIDKNLKFPVVDRSTALNVIKKLWTLNLALHEFSDDLYRHIESREKAGYSEDEDRLYEQLTDFLVHVQFFMYDLIKYFDNITD